jgi:hypothetical protein
MIFIIIILYNNNMAKRKKINILKKRKKLIREKKKELQKKDMAPKSVATKPLDIRLEKETKLYWVRAITGALSAFVGRLVFGFFGWYLFFWMLGWWFLFPFAVSFLIFKYKYDKEEWNWKNILMPGIGIYFFLFMIVGVITHTLLNFIPDLSSIIGL